MTTQRRFITYKAESFVNGRTVGFLCVTLLLIFIPGRASPLDETRIALSSPGLAAWPIHVAFKKDFFRREGLEVQVIVMRTDVGVAALVAGDIQYVTGIGVAMRAAVKGAPLKVIAVLNDKADLWIMGRKDIPRVEQLRGKIVGVGGMQGTQFLMVRDVLKYFGIENDAKILSTGDVRNGFLSLQQGAVDAAALTPPYNVVAKKMGFTLLARTSDIVGLWPTTGLVSSTMNLEKNPEQARRVIRAVLKTLQFAKTNKSEMVGFITQQYRLANDVAADVYDVLMETFNPTLKLSDQAILREIKRIEEQTRSKIVLGVSDLVDFSIVNQAANDLTR